MKYTSKKFRKATDPEKITKYIVKIALRHIYENNLQFGLRAATALVSFHCLQELKLQRLEVSVLKPMIEARLTSLGFDNSVEINGETIEITVSWAEEEL